MKMLKPKKLMCMFPSVLMGAIMFPAHEISAATVLTENTPGSEDGYDYELGNVEAQYLATKK